MELRERMIRALVEAVLAEEQDKAAGLAQVLQDQMEEDDAKEAKK